jgi:type I restriction-modification system DNA methylase subunit
VFGEDSLALGSRVPFYNDSVVELWRAFVEEIHEFDFSRLDYEVIGNMVERLISPEERHKFGQYYTRVEVVDLINSFAISNGQESLMDPACGGGTFLVRAYARKRELSPDTSHAERLQDLFGVDISRIATHLTTINLATRDLVDEDNYPQIARDDFLNVQPRQPLFSLPAVMPAGGLGKAHRREVQIPPLDAVIGNPPYIRQEQISTPLKSRYQEISRREGAKLTKRSDIHCYFWPHGTSFLKDDGCLCFLTSR